MAEDVLPISLSETDRNTAGRSAPSVDPADLLECRWEIAAGHTLPLDHGYSLASALFREFPWAHDENVQLVLPTGHVMSRGEKVPGWLAFQRSSRIAMRVTADRAPLLACGVGKTLEVDRHMIRLGACSFHPLSGSPSLFSRCVVIRLDGKHRDDPDGVWEAVARQLIKVVAVPRDIRIEVLNRRTMRIGDATSIGYAVRVSGLTHSDSLAIQAVGVGGRRRFGCGVFVPSRDRP